MRKSLHRDESGLASIVIAILIIIILSTMIIGFLQITRREQRRTLDRQLSSQAFYAAESGVNDAVKAITDQNFTANKTTCAPFPAGGGPLALSGNSNKLTGDGNVQYSCLLIDQEPTSLEYKSVRTDHSMAFPLNTADGTSLNSVTFTWRSTISGYDKFRPAGATDFPQNTSWNSTGLLRVDLVPTNNLINSVLIASAKTFFLYPNKGTGVTNVSFSTEQSGAIVPGNCSGSGDSANCSVTFILPSGVSNSYYARVIAMYSDVSLKVVASSVLSPTSPTALKGAQVQVDVTGKAADVSRRIQVRVPLINTDVPDFALASMGSLCKKFTVLPPTPPTSSGMSVDPSAVTESACNVFQ